VALAETPTLDSIFSNCPHSTLTTFGERVGLPRGQMGNSEVGHLNIGAGRVVEQWLQLIKREFEQGTVSKKKSYQNFIKAGSNRVHLIGLFSDGGVHSHLTHLNYLIELLQSDFSGEIVLHLITDGRDTSPTAAMGDLENLTNSLTTMKKVKIASISGRFFAMDRDNRWERTEKAYHAIAEARAPQVVDPIAYLKQSYANGTTDEFLEPVTIEKTPIEPEDGIIFFNFRSDRMRQICRSLCDLEFLQFSRSITPPATSRVLCFTRYEEDFPYGVLFQPMEISNHLGNVISTAGLKQLRIAETEKYPHVTYFLNGGEEEALPGESRVLIPSPRDVATYDLKPEMSAPEVTAELIKALESSDFHLIVVNFANGDMVGHTGVLKAAVEAVETVDTCLSEVLTTARAQDISVVVIADHGNAEQMIDYNTGGPQTAHTTYPVPIAIVGDPTVTALKEDGALCDVAPTLLDLMQINQPPEMTGRSLLIRKA